MLTEYGTNPLPGCKTLKTNYSNTNEVFMSKQQEYANEYGVKAYNQGFYKFGPMEQCATGEWVKWKDVEPFLRAAELRVQTAMETEDELRSAIRSMQKLVDDWRDLYRKENSFNRTILRWNSFWRIMAFGFLVMEGITVYMLTHGY